MLSPTEGALVSAGGVEDLHAAGAVSVSVWVHRKSVLDAALIVGSVVCG